LADFNYKNPCHVFALHQKRAANWVVPESPSLWRKGVRKRDHSTNHNENPKQASNSAVRIWPEYRGED
jgi:hypothetical protein